MEILKTILEIGTYLQWIAVAMFIMGGTGLVLRGLTQKNNRAVVLGIAIGLTPFLVPIAINTVQKVQRHARRTAVAAMPREALAASYPRQLLFRGDMVWNDLARLMVLTDLDQVMVENGNGRAWYSRADHSEGCRAAARAASLGDNAFVLHASQQRGDVSQSDQLKADRLDLIAQIKQRKTASRMLVTCGPTDRRAFPFSSRYLLARADQAVTHRAQDRRAVPEAIQIDLIENGREHLTHYDEMPVTDARFSTFALPLEHPKYPCAGGFDDAQVIANVLDATRARGQADAIMVRKGRRDLCVRSQPPID